MLGGNNPHKRQKHRVAVEIELKNGDIILGNIFLAQGQRLSDALNDTRRFLPVEVGEGEIVHLAKIAIDRASEVKRRSKASVDAYELLGITPRSSDEELRKAYLDAVKETHPDRWLGLSLPDEAIDALNRRLAVLNSAYQRILRSRKLPGGAPEAEAVKGQWFGQTAPAPAEEVKEKAKPDEASLKVENILDDADEGAVQDEDDRPSLQLRFRPRQHFGRRAVFGQKPVSGRK